MPSSDKGAANAMGGLQVWFGTNDVCFVLATEAEQQLRLHGRNELEEKSTSKLLIFLKLVSLSCVAMVIL